MKIAISSALTKILRCQSLSPQAAPLVSAKSSRRLTHKIIAPIFGWLLLTVPLAALAVTYATPITTGVSGVGTYYCTVINVGKKDADVNVELIDSVGTPFPSHDIDSCNLTGVLESGKSCIVKVFTGNASGSCQVSSNSHDLRVTLIAIDVNGVVQMVLPATM